MGVQLHTQHPFSLPSFPRRPPFSHLLPVNGHLLRCYSVIFSWLSSHPINEDASGSNIISLSSSCATNFSLIFPRRRPPLIDLVAVVDGGLGATVTILMTTASSLISFMENECDNSASSSEETVHDDEAYLGLEPWAIFTLFFWRLLQIWEQNYGQVFPILEVVI
ncbi:hypothetical protein C2S52_000914 [Perilla frutescens var. hirtella]|nr:hypothetical protein C2S52_000914 [Perilla frutescens var. hirtella]